LSTLISAQTTVGGEDTKNPSIAGWTVLQGPHQSAPNFMIISPGLCFKRVKKASLFAISLITEDILLRVDGPV
jgi:hypothetical protein